MTSPDSKRRDEFNPFDDALQVITVLLASANETGDLIQSLEADRDQALKAQLIKLQQAAKTPGEKSRAAQELGVLQNNFPSLPEHLKSWLAKAILDLFPNTTETIM